MKHGKYIPVLFLLLFCASCSEPDFSGNPQQAQTNSKEIAPTDGSAIFAAKCSSCHGSDGTAGIVNAVNLQLSKVDSTTVVKTITEGKGAMPAFKGQLTKEEIAQLVQYVKSLRK